MPALALYGNISTSCDFVYCCCCCCVGIIHLEGCSVVSRRKRQLQRTRFPSRVGPLLNNKPGNHDEYDRQDKKKATHSERRTHCFCFLWGKKEFGTTRKRRQGQQQQQLLPILFQLARTTTTTSTTTTTTAGTWATYDHRVWHGNSSVIYSCLQIILLTLAHLRAREWERERDTHIHTYMHTCVSWSASCGARPIWSFGPGIRLSWTRIRLCSSARDPYLLVPWIHLLFPSKEDKKRYKRRLLSVAKVRRRPQDPHIYI